MASKFVSAGGAEIKAPEGLSSATDDAWAKARQQVEENKKPKQEAPAPGTQEGGISLYEHLQNQRGKCQARAQFPVTSFLIVRILINHSCQARSF